MLCISTLVMQTLRSLIDCLGSNPDPLLIRRRRIFQPSPSMNKKTPILLTLPSYKRYQATSLPKKVLIPCQFQMMFASRTRLASFHTLGITSFGKNKLKKADTSQRKIATQNDANHSVVWRAIAATARLRLYSALYYMLFGAKSPTRRNITNTKSANWV